MTPWAVHRCTIVCSLGTRLFSARYYRHTLVPRPRGRSLYAAWVRGWWSSVLFHERSIHGSSKRSGWSSFGRTTFHGHFWNCACADNEYWTKCLGPLLQLCFRRARIRHIHFLLIAMATATGSITDSTAQDNIPEKGTSASELKVSQVHIWAKESCVPGVASGNGWLSAELKDVTSFN